MGKGRECLFAVVAGCALLAPLELASSRQARAQARADEAARADDEDGPPKKHEDRGRRGDPLVYETPPTWTGGSRACSLRLPLCVKARSAGGILPVLAAAERAWDALTGPLDFPAPDLDPENLAYTLYLVGGGNDPASAAFARGELATTVLAARDVRSNVDRARAFTLIDARARPGCALDGAIAAALARAVLYRVAPATDEGTARAQTVYLSELVAPCAIAYAEGRARAFQSAPERAIPDARAGAVDVWPGSAIDDATRAQVLYAEGASLFWARVDWAFGRSPGGIVHAAWALAPTETPIGAAEWRNEPDSFDVLRVSFKNALHSGSTLNDLLLDFAVARAFLGAADDGLHDPETRPLGEAARVAIDWEMAWPDKPHRIAPRAPVAPTGASYVLVHHAGARAGARLRVEMRWEEHALFRWALVKLDAGGRELGRVVVPSPERATEAQMTLVDLDQVDRILLVGVNTGDPAYGFDPDDRVWEPHGWLLDVAEE